MPTKTIVLLVAGTLLFAACAAGDTAETTATTSAPTTSTTAEPPSSGDTGSGDTDPATTDVDTTDETPIDDLSPGAYLGLTLHEATERADAQARIARVVKVDGEAMTVTDDLRIGRVNLTLEDGMVTAAQTDWQLVQEATGMTLSEVLISVSVGDALAIAENQGRVARVVRLDGEDLLVTEDFIADRVNLVVEDGLVTEAATDEEMASG